MALRQVPLKGSDGRTPEFRLSGAALEYRLVGDTAWQSLGNVKGPPGDSGVSSYQTWLSLGNSGDEAAFIQALKGAVGNPGAPGASVTEASINGSGDLILNLSSGGPLNAGKAKGEKGDKGDAGSAGMSVTGAAIDGSGRLIVTLSSGSPIDAGQAVGPPGPKGDPGSGGGGPTTVVTDGSTITGDGSAGSPLVAHVIDPGLPPGGTPGQVLTRNGSGDLIWADDQTGLDMPAGGSTGQVLTRTTDGYAWATPSAGASSVALDNFGTPSLAPAARPTGGDAYRFNGPTRIAGSAPLTFTRVTIPLRNVAGGEQVAFLILDEVAANNRIVRARRNFVLTAGQTEIVIEGPFVVPAGATYHFIVGDPTGGADIRNRFYGDQTTLTANSQPVSFWFTNSGISQVQGQTLDAGIGSTGSATHRIVLLEGQNVSKGILGPLAPGDMPRVAAAADLPNGGHALLTASLPPRMVYRHTNGTLYYGPVYSASP